MHADNHHGLGPPPLATMSEETGDIETVEGGREAGTTDEVLDSIPTPIVRLLVILAKPIYFLRKAIEILSWKSTSSVDSWLAVGCWWALCFAGRATWKIFLPAIIVLPFLPAIIVLPFLPVSFRPSILLPGTRTDEAIALHGPDKPASASSIIMTLSHLHAINAMLPSAIPTTAQRAWLRSWQTIERRRLVRGGMITWTTWIILNLFLGGRATLALIGSALLLTSSPAIRAMYGLLSQSLFARRFAALVFLVVFGSPPSASTAALPSDTELSDRLSVRGVRSWIHDKWQSSRRPSLAFRLLAVDGSAIDDEPLGGLRGDSQTPSGVRDNSIPTISEPLYFRFELQENQRWWMGLDWTSALLPQERPSWCDAYLNPSSPPSGFGLPSESTMYLPEPRNGDLGGRTKRISRWRWLDEDWSVVKRVGAGSMPHPVSPALGIHPAASAHGRSASLSFSEGGPAPAVAVSDEPRKGIAEQAFVKGLERLKARTMAGSSSMSGGSPAKRPMSGDYGEQASSQERAQFNPPRSSFDTVRRKSSAASDLAEALSNNVSTGQNASSAPRILGGGSANTASGSLSLLTDLEVATDADGWCYGDNKWENMGPKGGMGRYTRRRRWQRRAMCTEEVLYIPGHTDNSEAGMADIKTEARSAASSIDPASRSRSVLPGYTLELPSGAASPATVPATVMTGTASIDTSKPLQRRESHSDERDQVLRQRLKTAMANVGS